MGLKKLDGLYLPKYRPYGPGLKAGRIKSNILRITSNLKQLTSSICIDDFHPLNLHLGIGKRLPFI